MAKRDMQKEGDLSRAVIEANSDAVRQMLARGIDPDGRGDHEDPTPLMIAAARGRLDVVEALVAAGADVNAQFDDQSDELDQFPFLDQLHAAAELHGLFPLAYAALYRQKNVYDFLDERTAPPLRKRAEAIRQASATKAPRSIRAYGEPARPKSVAKAARESFLAANAKARRWVNACLLCDREGYKPQLPEQIDDKGTAAQLRRLYNELPLNDRRMCGNCMGKVAAGLEKAQAKRRKGGTQK
jgi:ankyrin repeat protein